MKESALASCRAGVRVTRIALKGRIVMGPTQAVEGAAVLGARVLVPIHDAHGDDWLWRFIRGQGTAADAERIAAGLAGSPLVVDSKPGSSWSYPPASPGWQAPLRAHTR